MTSNQDDFSIIRTKLHRPGIPGDLVNRVMLEERLQSYSSRPAILVSAPAGYGKSTLVSCWLETYGHPYAWLSLDRNDNDLKMFLVYFVAAVQSQFPDALTNSAVMVNAPNLPPVQRIVTQLANELDIIGQDFVLVLDDIHHIKKKSIHDFLDSLLSHPPLSMHLVIISRRDPRLSISTLRARRQLGEIRILDLRFSKAETKTYLEQLLLRSIDSNQAAKWAELMEGWVTGLRLAGLSIIHSADTGSLPQMEQGTQYVMEYLFNEVLTHQPQAIRDMLLETSILNRFCAPLCDDLYSDREDSESLPDGAWTFIQHLKKENLFILNLDAKNHWFRYHHLFQQLLQNQLKRKYPSGEIAALHARASKWFETQGLIEEAIHYALSSGNHESAADIIERHRHDALNRDKWFVIQNWLAHIPEKIIEQSPELLLAKAWVLNHQFRLIEIPEILKRVDSLLERETGKQALIGEIYFFKAFLLFWEGQVESSAEISKKAQEQIPKEEKYDLIRGDNEIYYAMALQMNGKGDVAIRELKEKIAGHTKRKGMYFTRLISSPCFVHLLSGDLKQVETASLQLKNVSKKSGLSYADSWSDYMQACCHFHAYDLDKACHHFSVIAERKYIMHNLQSASCLAGLAMTYQATGRTEEAEATMDQLNEYAIEMNEPNLIVIARSARVRLSLIQGNLEPGIVWVRTFDEPLQMASFFVWLELPHVTLCRVLTAIGSNDSLIKACERLELLLEIADTIHNTFHKIDILILQGLAFYRLSRIQASLKVLEEAIKMAIPGQWIRPFVEAGPMMGDMLNRLQKRNIANDRVTIFLDVLEKTVPGFIQKASGRDHREAQNSIPRPVHPSSQPLTEALSNREIDVLELLDRRMRNKEIAEKLCISPQTVASHLRKIFQKLGVNNRLQASQVARDLKIL